MAEETILTEHQQKLLQVISTDETISKFFYLTGGTALAEFYLHHRLSEDLDFFSETEFEPQSVYTFLKSIQKKTGIRKIVFEQSFNRNLFFVHLPREIIKTEFTYFPFPRIEKKKKINKLAIDSLLDIAVNKIFTIYQQPRSRDFIDVYCILQKKPYAIRDLIKKAKIKFDWHVDPIQLGSRFLQARTLKDYPRMLTNIDDTVWQNFFVNEAKKLQHNIFS
ncbi:MAG: nucleotidyl transferase AbiEii/AbiGii toxin family protein [bacterium]|nr:nucleotidyl transferase AbiEii/AbiGii toxin family protein [bacterium]